MAMITTRLSDSLSSVNVENTDGSTAGLAAFFFNLLQTLLSAGWTHWASGTGTSGTFSTTPGNGNLQITNSGTGAGGLRRNNAWFILRCPASKRQILIQRGTNDTAWRAYYSALDTFNGTAFGTVSATVPPSAADRGQILGASDAYDAQWAASGSSAAFFHVVAFSDPVATDVYSFFAWASDQGGTNIRWCFMLDGTTGPAADADPVVMLTAGVQMTSSTFAIANSSQNYLGWRGWFKMNLVGEAFLLWSSCQVGLPTSNATAFPAVPSSTSPAGSGADWTDQAENQMEMLVLRAATAFPSNTGVKGIPIRLRYNGAGHRAWPSRVKPSSSDARVMVDCLSIPWPADVRPAV